MSLDPAGRDAGRRSSQRRIGRGAAWAVLGVIMVAGLFPVYWALRTALSNNTAIIEDTSSLLPPEFTTFNFERVLADQDAMTPEELARFKQDVSAVGGNDVGVAVHTIGDGPGDVTTDYLTDSAQALAALVTDLDGDGYSDVLIGNDLGTPDRMWRWDPMGLTRVEMFDATSLSTMSLDAADIDNDGDHDLVSTDMAPLPGEPDEVWDQVADDIEQARIDDVQQPRNVIQVATPDGFDEQAIDLGVDASGWSWSGVFGDLDQDGLVDLYIVNGMEAETIFTDLAGGELVEPNQAFRNTGDRFDRAPDWGLAATEGGRGMSQADLDGDGDLDIVVNNLNAPAVIFENELCGGGSITVDLVWSGVQNVDALGATVTIDDGGDVKVRHITGARGYLSTSTTGAHIGLGTNADRVDVVVRWPDGETSVIGDVPPGTSLRVTRSSPPAAGALPSEDTP